MKNKDFSTDSQSKFCIEHEEKMNLQSKMRNLQRTGDSKSIKTLQQLQNSTSSIKNTKNKMRNSWH